MARPGNAGDPIVAGFFVNGPDNSLASLEQHVNDLDWVVCEWSFLAPAGDSMQFDVNRKVFDVVRKSSVESPPAILLMVNNFDRRARDSSSTGKMFSQAAVKAMLRSPARAHAPLCSCATWCFTTRWPVSRSTSRTSRRTSRVRKSHSSPRYATRCCRTSAS